MPYHAQNLQNRPVRGISRQLRCGIINNFHARFVRRLSRVNSALDLRLAVILSIDGSPDKYSFCPLGLLLRGSALNVEQEARKEGWFRARVRAGWGWRIDERRCLATGCSASGKCSQDVALAMTSGAYAEMREQDLHVLIHCHGLAP